MIESFERIDPQGRPLPPPAEPPERAEQLVLGEGLHRQLRPGLDADYVGLLALMFSEGARLTHLFDEGVVKALAVWRIQHTTFCGRQLYVDDLVTLVADRSRGYGRTLLARLEAHARALDCSRIALASATHRSRAHRFYFRENYRIAAFHFTKDLEAPAAEQAPEDI